MSHHCGVNGRRANRIDPNSFSRVLQGGDLGHAHNSVLACSIGDASPAGESGYGRGIDYGTTALLEHLIHLQRGAIDEFEKIARLSTSDLTQVQKRFLMQYFFSLNQNFINQFSRYLELQQIKNDFIKNHRSENQAEIFSTQELLDLQVLFHLGWSGYKLRKNKTVSELLAKGRDFTENDKKALLDVQSGFINGIIPFFQNLKENTRAEFSFSPFYHPILPLLIDQKSALVSRPHERLPGNAGRFPQEAIDQILQGKEYFVEMLGFEPDGVWPSEGAVSEAVIGMAAGINVRWIATDDEILKRTVGAENISADTFLKPYRYSSLEGEIAVFFRNHFLSDRIGFAYSRMSAKDAVDDFLGHLRSLAASSSLDHPHVSIILDGENAWEYFPDHGEAFLSLLTERLNGEDWIKPATFSQYLDEFGMPENKILDVYPGSWIYGNLATWIGHEEKNRAWELLINTIETAGKAHEEKKIDSETWTKITKELHIAEGSDWFWWYGEDHHTDFAAEFDTAFRRHLQNVYTLLGARIPSELFQQVFNERPSQYIVQPRSFINSLMDGKLGGFFEWRGSGSYSPHLNQGAIHKTDFIIKTIRFGFNPDTFFILLDTGDIPAVEAFEDTEINITFKINSSKMVINIKKT